MPEEPFYFTGGTLPLHATSYVVREADAELVARLLRGEFCYVLNTRQMGKSSLMVRTAQELRNASTVFCVLDLTAVGQDLTLDQWYCGMLRRMAIPLGLLSQVSAFWRDHKELGPLQRWMEALQEVMLPALAARERAGEPSRLVVFIDEIDAVKSLSFSTDEFFGGIRACYNRRAEDPLYERLTFCLLGVASPADLISDVRLSPFNIGSRILLADFTAQEAAPLAHGLPSLAGPGAAALLERVLYWTGGHPYMTQRLCLTLAQEAEQAAGGKPLSRVDVDTLCAKLFLIKSARNTDPNLAFVRSRLLRSDCDLAALLEMYRRIRAGQKVKDDETDPLCVTLRLSGVVREKQGYLAVRNRIYDHVFDPAWVTAHMPDAELRRQKAAYRLGILRTASVSLAVILIMTILAVTAKVEAGKAVTATGEARRNLLLVTAKEAQVQSLNTALTGALARQEITNGQLKSALADAKQQGGRARKQTTLAQKETGRANAATVRATTATGVAQAQTRLAVRRQSDLNADAGARLIQDGDAVAALPSLTRALKLDRSVGDTARENLRRVQIAGVLARTPRLDHIWFAKEAVASAAFSPDASLIATEAAGGEVQVIDAKTGTLCWSARHGSQGQKVAFSPDGRCLATTWLDGTAQVADARTGRLLTPVGQLALKRPTVGACVPHWSPDSHHLAIYAGDQVVVWDLLSGKTQFTFRIAGITVEDAAFSPDGRHLALAIWRWRSLVLDADTGTICSTIDRCWNAHSIEFTPDGKSLLTDGTDALTQYNRAGLFDVQTGQPIRIFSPEMPATCRLSPDGKQALIIHRSRQIQGKQEGVRACVYSTRTGEALSPSIALSAETRDAQFSPDGSRLLFACIDGSVSIRDATSGALSSPTVHHAGEVVAASFDSSGLRLLTAGVDQTTRLWSFRPKALPVSIYRDDVGLSTTPLLEASRTLLFSNLRQEAVLVDSVRGVPLLRVPASAARPSEDERTLGIVSHDAFRVYNTRTGKPLTPSYPLPANALQTELCPDGRHYWVLTAERALQSFVTATGVAVGPPAYTGKVMSCVSSHDGNLLIELGLRDLQEWDPATARPLGALMVHAVDLSRIWFLPERHLLITRTNDKETFLWDLRSGRLRAQINLHRLNQARAGSDLKLWLARDFESIQFYSDVGSAAAITAQGRRALDVLPTRGSKSSAGVLTLDVDMAAGAAGFSVDRTRFVPLSLPGGMPQGQGIYDTATGHQVVSLPQDQAFTGAHFSRDGRRVLTSTTDGLVRLWNAQTGYPLSPPMQIGIRLDNGDGSYGSEELSPDGNRVAAIDSKGNLRVWDLASGDPLIPAIRSELGWFRFTQDSRCLIVGTRYGILRLDLSPDSRPEADFDRLNALLCGQHIDADGNRMEVGLAEVRKAWDTLRSHRSPDFAAPSQQLPDWTHDLREQRNYTVALSLEKETILARQKKDRMRTALLVGQDDADSWFGLACDSAAHKQWEQTLLATDALLRKTPDDANVWYLRAVAFLSLGQEEHAKQEFAQMVQHGGRVGEAIAVSARVHREQKHWQAAAADYARLSADPHLETRMTAARPEALLRLKAGDRVGYAALCARMRSEISQTANPGYLAELLEIASLGQSPTETLHALVVEGEKAYAAYPADAGLLHTTSCLLFRVGRDAEAIARLEKAVPKESGEDAIHSLLFLAMAHRRLHHDQQAQTYLADGRQKAEAYLRSTQDLSDSSEVWAPRLEMELLLAEASRP